MPEEEGTMASDSPARAAFAAHRDALQAGDHAAIVAIYDEGVVLER